MDVPLVADQVGLSEEAAGTGLAHIRQGPMHHLVMLLQGCLVDKTGRTIDTLLLVLDLRAMFLPVLPQLPVYLGPPTACLTHQILLSSAEAVVLFEGQV